ncbi:MAG: hypothetical protein QM753_06895 [Thermomicrobiales bacterium]
MSKLLKLAAALPGIEDVNGLDCYAQELVDNPDGQTLTAIVILDVKDVRYSVAEGAHIPTVQVRRVEAWLTEGTPQAIRDALVARQEERTNRTPLEFGAVEPSGGADDE